MWSLLRAFLARRWMILIGISYVAIGMLSRFYGYHQEDAAWFVHVTDRILDGSFALYGGRAQPWAAPPQGMAFTYPPLMPFLLVPFVLLGRAFDLSARNIEVLVGLPWLVCDVLLAWQIAALTGQFLTPGSAPRPMKTDVAACYVPGQAPASEISGQMAMPGAALMKADVTACCVPGQAPASEISGQMAMPGAAPMKADVAACCIPGQAPASEISGQMAMPGAAPMKADVAACCVPGQAPASEFSGQWTGQSAARGQIIAYPLCLLTFIVPFSSAYMGHHESLIMLVILAALRASVLWSAGLLWGLALALKQTAGFALIPMALLVLLKAGPAPRAKIAHMLAFFLPLVALPVALILPFWLMQPFDTSYSLLEVERYRILYGTNLPHLADRVMARLMPALQPAFNAFLVRWSSLFFVLTISAFSFLIVLRQVRCRSVAARTGAFWSEPLTRKLLVAVMGTNMAAFLVLGKWTETHYQFIPFMLLLVLDLLERPDYPYVYVLFVLAGTLPYVFADPISSYWRLAMFMVLTGYFVIRAWRLSANGLSSATAVR